jgi:uncharacterized membrane protein (DUF485 family)
VQHRPLTPAEWDKLAADPAFHALIAAKLRFVVPATVVFVVAFFSLVLLLGFDQPLMSTAILGPLTVANVFALGEFVLAWALLALYLQKARAFDVAAAAIADRARKELVG